MFILKKHLFYFCRNKRSSHSSTSQASTESLPQTGPLNYIPAPNSRLGKLKQTIQLRRGQNILEGASVSSKEVSVPSPEPSIIAEEKLKGILLFYYKYLVN